MCYVTATELKNNLSYYLEKSATEDVYVTKNKKVISIMTNPQLKAYFEFKKYLICLLLLFIPDFFKFFALLLLLLRALLLYEFLFGFNILF